MADVTFRISMGSATENEERTFKVPVAPGWVVLDAVHYIQAKHAPDLAVQIGRAHV